MQEVLLMPELADAMTEKVAIANAPPGGGEILRVLGQLMTGGIVFCTVTRTVQVDVMPY